MRLDFLKNVAVSPFLLPLAAMLSALVWIFVRPEGVGMKESLYGLLVTTLTVYLLTELNNRNLLLRNNSRMIATVMSLLLAAYVPFHSFGFPHVVLLLMVLAYFPLLFTYRTESPVLSFLTFLILSAISTRVHVFLLVVPVYWVGLIYLRSFTFRMFVASLLGLLLPCWLFAGYMALTGNYDGIVKFFDEMAVFEWTGLSELTRPRIAGLAFSLFLFVAGTIDYYMHSYLDKTRVRTIYRVFVIHALVLFVFLFLQMQYYDIIFPVLLIDVSLLGGHYLAQNYSRVAHVVAIIFILSILGFIVSTL